MLFHGPLLKIRVVQRRRVKKVASHAESSTASRSATTRVSCTRGR